MSEGAAGQLPIARVAVAVSLAHLDRPFDYFVPPELNEQAQPGCRVKVRFSGKDVDGFVVGRLADSEHPGRLTRLRRVVSPEPVLSPEIERLTRAVADRYAGSQADVLRLAVPPRHARVEREPAPQVPAARASVAGAPDPGPWAAYPGGEAFLARLRSASPRAVWTALPRADWPLALATAAATAFAAGRGALVCLPDHRDVQRVAAATRELIGDQHLAVLTADLGPAARYRAFLAVRRGSATVVVGTRAAVFAPVRDLGLVAIWDDGDDLHAEPRAPYPHAREVLALRADHSHCAALLAGVARSTDAQLLIDAGWARPLQATRALVRRQSPRVHVAGAHASELARDPAGGGARLPRPAFDAVKGGLERGPVLVHVPRAGYAPALSCASCLAGAVCAHCTGPLAVERAAGQPSCRWCGRAAIGWRCARCGGHRLRAPVIGSTRTAEELARAFPGTPVRRSGGDHVLAEVDGTPALVVATPGAEPVAAGGYAAALVLDVWLTLARADLRTAEEALRRWLNAAALVRPATEQGRLLVVADSTLAPVQALVRWDPAGFAERELAERAAARLPPATPLASIDGSAEAVRQFLDALPATPGAEVLGPVPAPARPSAGPAEPAVRAVVRAPRRHGGELLHALRAAQAIRSARKLAPVRVRVDPVELG